MRIDLKEAETRLNGGEVIAIPTETVYGLAAKANDPNAIEKLFLLKNRPRENPLIIHIDDVSLLRSYVEEIPKVVFLLASAFWPGPLTLVLPVKEGAILPSVCAGLKTQAFRIPKHSITRDLLKITGPLVAPSANLSGKPSSVTPEQVEEDFGSLFPVLDGGRSDQGVESTILVWDGKLFRLGRLGAIPAEAFKTLLGYVPEISIAQEKPLCPGQMFRHYAPHAQLHWASDLTNASVIIGLKGRSYPLHARVFYLGSEEEPEEAAHVLYTILRRLDEEKIAEAWIDAALPRLGLWATIVERLRKASASSSS